MKLPQLPHMLAGLFLVGSFSASCLHAEIIRVAVASNFRTTMKELAQSFTNQTGHQVLISSGSTGKHYAQIKNGAPFDLFFAADVKTPKLLEEQGLTVANSRETYAIGRLVMWSPKKNLFSDDTAYLTNFSEGRIAIANPKHAPYGMAAKQVMQSLQVWHKLSPNLVRGENIGQTYQFVHSENAQLGFLAYAQVKHTRSSLNGSIWVIPQSHYQPIAQQAVLLTNNKVAQDFWEYVKSDTSRSIIANYGYSLP